MLDEVHLTNVLQGGHARGLFNRLRAIRSGRPLSFIAASATIADPKQHIETIWGTLSADVVAIEPIKQKWTNQALGW